MYEPLYLKKILVVTAGEKWLVCQDEFHEQFVDHGVQQKHAQMQGLLRVMQSDLHVFDAGMPGAVQALQMIGGK